MTMKRIFVTRRIPDEGLAILREKFEVVVNEKLEPPSKDELIAGLKDADGAVTLLTDRMDEEVLAKAPKLRIIANLAAGFDNIDLDAATRRGVCVTNTPGVLSETTADLAFALLLSTARKIPQSDRYVREKNWKEAWHPMLMLGQDVHGKTIGIVGMGRIGLEMAKRAKGFGMKIVYTNEKNNPEADAIGCKKVSLDDLTESSDFISLHVPLTSETKNLFDAKRLARMKRTAILINTARGAVVDQKALAEALKKGTITGAGLDVYEKEPIEPDDPLLSLENVILAPHIGSGSLETRSRMSRMVAENITAYFAKKKPPQLLNPKAWKK